MTLSPAVKDREQAKFRDAGGALSRVAVSVENGILSGIEWDDVLVTYPTSTTEQYAFYLDTILQRTIEITYTAADKSFLLRARVI